MRLCVLGSGSSGNALLIQSGDTTVLIDCGFSAKELAKRIAEVGANPSGLAAIIITHEHADHIKGLSVFARTTKTPVFMSRSLRNYFDFGAKKDEINFADDIAPEANFQLGAIEFQPFTIPHDAVDPLAFTFTANGAKAGIVTDLGYYTQLVADRLQGCDCLILEANHDIEMLKIGPYPWGLKQRVLSRQGHSSNEEMARFLREDFDGKAEHIILAHLSRTTNHPDIARLCALQALDSHGPLFYQNAEKRLKLARQDRPMEWIEL